MATAQGNSIFGLLNPQGKGKISLQTLGQAPIGEDDVDENGLPTSPFANLPIGSLGGNGLTPGQIQAVQAANLPANFQFTGEFDAANRALLQAETDAGFQRKNTLASIAEQYLQATRQAEQQNKKGRKSLFASLADRGALGSGAALESVADYDTTYNDYLNNLSRGRAADIANAENSFASVLNQLGRQREGLVSRQQQAEEQRRIEEERVRAEAERQRVAEEQRRVQIEQMIQAQQQAAAAAQAAAQAASQQSFSYSPVALGGGGGGYGYEPPPAPAPAQPAYKAGEQRITLPAGANGMTWTAFGHWVKNNLDANASTEAIKAVYNQLLKDTPNGGTPLSDIAWLIQQYPNITQGKPYNAGNGVRVF